MPEARRVMPIDGAFVPRLATKARLKLDRHTNRYMILYPERGLELNAEAAAITRLIDGRRSIAGITDALASEHVGTARDVIEHDVIELVAFLRDKGLLESV